MSQQSGGPVGSHDGNGVATGNGPGGAIDPASVAPVDSLASSGGPKRAGGWPKGKPRGGSGNDGRDSAGSGNGGSSSAGTGKTGKKTEALDLSGIEAALVGIHAGLAALTKNPAWEMDNKEAESVGKAVANVARHYPKLAGHEKLVDWVMLIQTLGMVYGTRIYLSMPEKKASPKQEASAPSGNLHLFQPGA